MSKRNGSIDILKTLGLFFIVMAHSRGLPAWLDYFRNFEVILLVIISGLLFGKGKTIDNRKIYLIYVRKRIVRLVAPTWIFLSCFFIILKIASVILSIQFPYTIWQIIDSYTMINGIGYVWIMLVYVWIAIGLPWLVMYAKNKKTHIVIISAILLIILYQFLVELIKMFGNNVIAYYINNTVPYFMIYPIVAAVGYWTSNVSRTRIIEASASFLIAYGLLALFQVSNHGRLLSLALFKYPPAFIYLFYGIGISLLLVWLVPFIEPKICEFKIFTFVGRKSQWIYLNHIYFIFIWNQFFDFDCWWAMTIFCFGGSIFITLLQTQLISRIPDKNWTILKNLKMLLG